MALVLSKPSSIIKRNKFLAGQNTGAGATPEYLELGKLGTMAKGEPGTPEHARNMASIATMDAKASSSSGSRKTTSQTRNSSGASYGTAGINRMGTSATSGRTTTSTTGERMGVDRSSAIVNDPVTTYLDLFSPKTMLGRQDEIRRELANQRQAQIDAIQNTYRGAADTLAQNKEEDLARQRSLNLRAGLAGSDFGTAAKIKVRDAYDVKARDLAATRDTAIAGAIKDIEDMANQRIQLTESGLQSGMQNTMALRNDAVTRIAMLGKSGLDVDTIRERDPQLYETIAVASGMGDVELEAILNANKPAPAKIDYQTIVRGGKITMFGVDPTTGQIKVLEQDAGIPDEYDTIQAQNGTILGVPKNWDGDPQKIVTLGSYRKPLASELGGGAGGGGVAGGSGAPTKGIVDESGTKIKLTATQADALANFENTIQASGDALALLQGGVSTGPIAGRIMGVERFLGTADEKQLKLDQLLGKIKADFMKAMSGAAVSEQEVARLSKFLPDINDQEKTIASKLGTLIEETKRSKGNLLSTLGAAQNFIEIEVRAPDGTIGTIPQEQLQQALAEGYTQI